MRKKDKGAIEIVGDRVNNLKGISVSIPRQKLTVITGVSGSGKSSLAFDTLYAEGQRRYVESLSSYSRQFLERMPKPDCDFILYIPPAVAIRQRTVSRNPRSTVGTSTEIYDYLKLLYARFGKTISPKTGLEVKKHHIEDVVAAAQSLPDGTRILLLAPIKRYPRRSLSDMLSLYQSEGYSRIFRNGEVLRIDDILTEEEDNTTDYSLVIDRIVVKSGDNEFLSRLADSVGNAFYEGHGFAILHYDDENGKAISFSFSNRFEENGLLFEEPSPELFDFNSPTGACPTCEGFGKTIGIAEELVVPYPTLSIFDDAVACWIGPKSSLWKEDFIKKSRQYDFPIHAPYSHLSIEQKKLLWKGIPGDSNHEQNEYDPTRLYGIDDYFAMMRREYYKIQNRVRIAHFSGKTDCPDCQGKRLKPEAMYVQYHGKNLAALTSMPISEVFDFFKGLELEHGERKASERLLTEISARLGVLCDVGLGYLTLDRLSNTLSGGESQRINLSSRLGSNLYGALYVLDEPSIGLHERDSERLLSVIERLRDSGNTIVVVEHDETIMRAADKIIDIGPDAGRLGGEVVFEGYPSEMNVDTPGYTAAYLTGRSSIAIPTVRRRCNRYIEVQGASQNNLKSVSARFPLGAMTVVTGVSGSGKSTLVYEALYKGLSRYLSSSQKDEAISLLRGDLRRIKAVEYVDQMSSGRSSRSNPATYIGAYDHVRTLYSSLPLSRQLGFTQRNFSFNVAGGRCETCKGEGTVTVEMQFMADLLLICDECGGKRFRKELLEVEYHEVNVYDLLDMTINQAVEFFTIHPKKPLTEAIISLLGGLQSVGLGYLKLGQNTSSLSGGEIQRLKLAYYLSLSRPEPTLFIFDEPTTGLHFHDIKTLLQAFEALIDKGHTVVIIEHNLEVIKCADHIIDMGPEGGKEGGYVVAEGTPEEVAANKQSYTARFLQNKLISKN